MEGSPCDAASSTGSGYLSVSYGTLDTQNETDSVSIVCDADNPNQQFALNVDVTYQIDTEIDCGGGGFSGPTYSCTFTGQGTVTSSDGLINCTDSNCTQDYLGGTTITLTATPGYDGETTTGFYGWSGCDSTSDPNSAGTDTVCTVSVNDARTVTAAFSD